MSDLGTPGDPIGVQEQPPGAGMHGDCPVCAAPYTAYVRDVPTLRTKRQIALYVCLECESFWNPSGYREDDRVLELDVKWGISVEDRNRSAADGLFATLGDHGIRPNSVAEIGCGIGTVLTVAQDRGIDVVGFDVNPHAVEYARNHNHINASAELWTAETSTPPIDLYLCISVLEHISEPRPLIEELCRAVRRQNASLFISVPFLKRRHWPFLLNPDPEVEGTPFFDSDVHVTHFSVAGLTTAMEQFGLPHAYEVTAGLWGGLVWTPDTADRFAWPAVITT